MITDLEKAFKQDSIYQYETHSNLHAITITLAFLGVTMPLLMVFLDKRDYQKVEDNYYDVNNFIIFNLQYSRQYLCK